MKKKKVKLTKKEWDALHYFLGIAYSDHNSDESETGIKTCEEIEKLQNKLYKIESQEKEASKK